LSINNAGQVVGGSGLCSNTPLLPLAFSPHAVLWDREGKPTEIPGLGGTKYVTAGSINDLGEVFGISSLPGNQTLHAFLWSGQWHRPIDLGTLAGDESSIPGALGSLNNRSEAVGASCVSNDPQASLFVGDCRAFLWRNGRLLDLNSLVVSNGNPSQLHLLLGFGINERGEISGWALTPSGEQHAFVASYAADR
jgi:probable HAF family extracellular repeat protein